MSAKQEKSNAQFDKVATQAIEFMLKKYDDYGSSWTYLRPHSLADQIFIKLKRIWTIQETGEQKVEDSINGDIFGILNYAAMALSRLRGDVGQNSTITKEEFEGFMKKSFTNARDLFQAKNHDYGEAWRDLSVSTMTDLMIQKIMRLHSIKRNKGKTKVSEGAAANYLDIMNYSIFCLIRIDEGINPMD
jgi:hypothetical protein